MNSEFVEIIDSNEANFRVWERGSGETWACGTGACAVLIAGKITKRLAEKAIIHLKGRDLLVEYDEQVDRIYPTGPFSIVGEGIFNYLIKRTGSTPNND